MGESQVSKTIDIDAPAGIVFERLVDHEAMGDWPGVDACVLVRDGEPRGGLGAVRRIRVKRVLSLDEEIVHYDPAVGYDYSITRGLPVDHLGRVRLEVRDEGIRLRWDVSIRSRFPFVAEVVGGMLDRGLDVALPWLKEDCEETAAAAS